MATQTAPRVFLSHSHSDKRVARRLVRRLTAHGIKVWIDERELRLGAGLTSSIRGQIQNADLMLVVASQASVTSEWVGLEVEFARQQSKPIVPFFIEPVAKHDLFRDHLGIDATSPQTFADAVHDLMRDLFLSFDLELPPADPAMLTAGLRELAKEEPDLAPLILGCLESEGLHQDNMDTVYKASFHPLDDALNALFDLMPKKQIAYHAASGFCLAGAGARALSSWIAATGDGDLPLVTAVGSKRLEPMLIVTAIKLLGACEPPNNHALYQFIHHNAAQLDQGQHRAVLRLVTWPVRGDTDRLADVLGWVALKHFPDAVEIQQMWSRWVYGGAFDGKPSAPIYLARYLASAHKERLPGWEGVSEALRSHVRDYLRSGDENKVVTAVEHIRAAADTRAPVLTALLREAEGVSATAEWNAWEERDREAAERMKWYVFEFAEEAAGERNWFRAYEGVERAVAFEKQRRRILATNKPEPSEAR
ncbi:MAG: toll/interleukin-1 receptor domain-containing protein [Candidatus Binatia bacterium]